MQNQGGDTVELLRKWHQGDSEALEALVERDLPWIHSHVRRRLGALLKAKAETQDFVQEVIVEFLKYGPRFLVSNRRHFRALLARIAENVLRGQYDRFTAQRRQLHRERPLPGDSVIDLDGSLDAVQRPSQVAEELEWQALVRFALELLQSEDRDLIVMREWEGCSFAEIGSRLDIKEDAARMRFHRALARLAECVQRVREGRIEELLDKNLDEE